MASLAAAAASSASVALAPPDFSAYTPRVEAVRIAESEAPLIDGDLSDPAWLKAAVIDDFYQVEPGEGVAPTQPTRAYIMFDEKTLYVGVYAYDSEPALIRRSQLRRDPSLRDDDGVRILIDPFGTFRDSFFFGVNPNSARSDALTENGTVFRQEWNAIWRAKARVVDDGWIVEFAIPFQSISFDSALREWNFQIIRTIRRNNEEIRWANIVRARGRIDMTSPGRLAGIENVSSGVGLELQAFATGATNYDWELDQTDFDFNPSGNVFYKITPSLTGSLTFNTDFSDAPLDVRQVNTGRFDLFFPETRDFFLQDAAVFEFGGEVFTRTVNGSPLFTRRIGIVDDAPVDIIAGAKVSGKQGPFNIGAIATRTGAADALGIDGQFLTAARVSANVLSESKAGVVFTHGNPGGESDNTLAGADFRYRKSSFASGGVLLADFVYLRSFTDGVGDELFGAALDYTGDKWGYNFVAREIGENYDPELGFANRTGIREYRGFTRRRFRPEKGPIRQYTFRAIANAITDLGDRVEDRFLSAGFNLQTNPGDEIDLEFENGFLDIREPFDIAGVVPVAVAQYHFNQYEVSASLTRSRPFSVGGGVRWGDMFDGDFLEVSGDISWRPDPHISLSGEYDFTKFSLPAGEVGIHIATIESTVAFTPDMFINTEIQYDNISENFTFFSRFSWEPVPEREIFISLGHSAIIERDRFPQSFRAQNTSLAIRLGHTFRL
ncbi:MAG: carbohydrate binding family 9 domain-containing protein [Parvularculaceae bacterium]